MGRWNKTILIVGLAAAAGLAGYTWFGPASAKRKQLKTELSRLNKENLSLKEENRQLTEQVHALKQRTDYLEKVTREELGLVKPDEIILRLNNKSNAADESQTRSDGGQ